MKLTPAQYKLLSASIYTYFNRQDDPPADEIYVPVDLIRQEEDEEDYYTAVVRFVTNYCGRKVHSIKIRFQIDERGRFQQKTFKYL